MVKRKINENVCDPCELLASLVDMGSVDIEDAFVACLNEMSDAECKRVLAKCGTGFSATEPEFPADAEDGLENADDLDDFDSAETEGEDAVMPEEEPTEDAEDTENVEEDNSELESRIRRLERSLRRDSFCRRGRK